jgi:hypothetical protein
MIHKALNAVIIHEIVASAPERTRRDDCAVVEQNAAAFAVRICVPAGAAFRDAEFRT